MARNAYFHFKQFQISQNLCAMKVTTDAIVFGAMIDTRHCRNILDIGSGTGLLSLMMAQKTTAPITAIELDDAAVEQSMVNIKSSPWPEQISVVHASIQQYTANNDRTFDCIVTNPPFFEQSLKGPDHQRNLARHSDSLDFSVLADIIQKQLSANGTAWVLLPVNSAKRFLQEASGKRLYPVAITELCSTLQHSPHRWIIQLSHQKTVTKKQTLVFYHQDRQYTEAFRQLTRDYYLKL